jgi:hypothetical protein
VTNGITGFVTPAGFFELSGKPSGIAKLARGIPDQPPPPPPPPGHEFVDELGGVVVPVFVVPVFVLHVLAFSLTMTLREAVAVFPAVSVYEYVNIYVPERVVFTTPLALRLPEPSTMSNHFAQASIYVAPLEIVSGDDPFMMIVGRVVSIIVTVREIEPVFPEVSTFVYVRVYTPGTCIFTEPEVARGIVPTQITVSE